MKLTPRVASRILRKHFDEVTPEQFRENVRRYNPHLITSDSTEASPEKAETADNVVGEKIRFLREGLGL
jgi:hypothetical protein